LKSLLFLIPALVLSAMPALADSLVLTQAVQVLELSGDGARAKVPVRLRGVVISGRDLPDGQAVVNDGSGSVYVFCNPPLVPSLAPLLMRTNLVEIEGVSDPGEYAPRVVLTKARVLGKGQIPPPRRVAFDEMLMGRLDSQWVEVEGCLRSCVYLAETMPSRRGGMEVDLATGGGRLAIEAFGHAVNPAWVDGTLLVRGICFHKFNQSRQFYQMYLSVPEGEPVVLKAPPAELANLPNKRVSNLLQFPSAGEVGHRVRVNGTVTYLDPGDFFYLHDGERGLFVRTRDDKPVAVGDEVSVAGFPAQGDYSPILEDATFAVLSHGKAPPPTIAVHSPADALQHDAELITGRAKLLGALRQDNGWTFSLQMDDAVFTAWLQQSREPTVGLDFETGSELGFTGVCSVVMGPLMPRRLVNTPQSFRLLLRSPRDLRLIAPPPWWTPQRILIAATIVVSLLTTCIGAIIVLGRARLLRQREARRAAESEFAAVFKERNRMARELHDTLAQGLGAISMHLEIVKEQRDHAPEKAAKHLDVAHQTARQSLAEARNSIWDMRAQILESATLADALQQILRQFTEDTETQGLFAVTGNARRLAPSIENSLLRTGQEAISNAMKHACPKTIRLELDYRPDKVTLTVRDDGIGFDPAHLPAGKHFGLLGLRERTVQAGGTLEVMSAPGRGTEVKVCIPG
jgi:signal transduction histidine kinase